MKGMKSRTFTIFLLNEGIEPTDALINSETLECVGHTTALPTGAILYLTKDKTNDPWWKTYLGIDRTLKQSYPGGILFIPVGNRWFAATFGQSYHHLSSSSYEYDFGLKTALNAIDKNSLRSTDVVNPETAKRERVQAPKDQDIAFFSFDGDSSTVLKRISGRVQKQYHDILSCVTGCDSIRVTTRKSADELVAFCENILGIYSETNAEEKFPEVFNIRSEKDSETLDLLDQELLNAIKRKDSGLILSYPDMLNYQNLGQIKFGSLAPTDLFTIDSFCNCISQDRLDMLTISRVKNAYSVQILDANGNHIAKTSPSLYKCLIFECDIGEKHYHFCEGKWYCVKQDLVEKLRSQLDPFFSSLSTLPANTSSCESDYNKNVAGEQGGTVLFDKDHYFPKGQSQIELCDLCQLEGDGSVSLIHVKVGVHSYRLSHLFSQGYVGTREILSDEGAMKHFEGVVKDSTINASDKKKIIDAVRQKRFGVVFAIITKKSPSLKSNILPLFSRINLRRAISSLRAMGITPSVQIVADDYIGKE